MEKMKEMERLISENPNFQNNINNFINLESMSGNTNQPNNLNINKNEENPEDLDINSSSNPYTDVTKTTNINNNNYKNYNGSFVSFPNGDFNNPSPITSPYHKTSIPNQNISNLNFFESQSNNVRNSFNEQYFQINHINQINNINLTNQTPNPITPTVPTNIIENQLFMQKSFISPTHRPKPSPKNSVKNASPTHPNFSYYESPIRYIGNDK